MKYKHLFYILVSVAFVAHGIFFCSQYKQPWPFFAPIGAAEIFLACIISVVTMGEYLIEYYFPEIDTDGKRLDMPELEDLVERVNVEMELYKQDILATLSNANNLADATIDIAAMRVYQLQITRNGGSR